MVENHLYFDRRVTDLVYYGRTFFSHIRENSQVPLSLLVRWLKVCETSKEMFVTVHYFFPLGILNIMELFYCIQDNNGEHIKKIKELCLNRTINGEVADRCRFADSLYMTSIYLL